MPARSQGDPSITTVHLVSESTGSLARHMFSVAISQFPQLSYELQEHKFCTDADSLQQLRRTLSREEHPMVFLALTDLRRKRALQRWCDKRDIAHCDLMGPMMELMATQTKLRPRREVARVHPCDDAYYRRIDAWEYTLQHDDSRRLETIGEADVILVGLSRVGKTPLAAYLGSLGLRVANVSIAPEVPVPAELTEHRAHAVGLTVDPRQLAKTRKRRFDLNGFDAALKRVDADVTGYHSLDATRNEMRFAQRLFRRLGIPVLEVTECTVEESAARVMELLHLHPLS